MNTPTTLRTLIAAIEAQKTRPVESEYTSHVAYARALEAYCDGLEAQPVQEPVAWRFHDGETWCYLNHSVGFDNPRFQALYTIPGQPVEQPRGTP